MKAVTIGIDIGGTNTSFGIVDRAGNCLAKDRVLTTDFDRPEDCIQALHQKIEHALNHIKEPIILKGIGIGAPNGNYYNGTIEHAPNLKWKGVINLIKLFGNYFDVPVAVTNDANAAAIGEMIYGAAQGMNDFMMVTLGTGVGSGIVSNGALIYGNDGFAGELGHTIIEPDGRECGCGRKGCLETYTSATGIVRTAHMTLTKSSKQSVLRDVPFKNITSKLIAEAAQNHDPLALEIFDYTAKKLGFSLANTIALTSPETIILFGGLAQAGHLLLEPTQQYMEANLLNIFKGKVKLILSSLDGNNAAILGASALAWQELDKANHDKVQYN
jgi:glucokinase